jgi:hypothetical protein
MNGTRQCTNCGIDKTTSPDFGDFIDDGWSFDYLAFGHYGGFTDCIPDPDEGEVNSLAEYDPSPYMAHLCHDCCVRMLEALPGLAKLIGPGGHSNGFDSSTTDDGTETPPCCNHAWTWKKEDGKWKTYLVNENGDWEKAKREK